MTVAELIEKLKLTDRDRVVVLADSQTGGYSKCSGMVPVASYTEGQTRIAEPLPGGQPALVLYPARRTMVEEEP